MKSTKTQEEKNRMADALVPFYFIAFFVVLAGLMAWFAWLATSTDRGVVTQDAYKKGLGYNRVIEKQQLQDALGWGSELMIDKKPGAKAKIRFMLRDKDKKPVTGAAAQITFVRPTQAGHDVTAPLVMDEPGVYRAEVDVPLPGLWEATVAARAGENNYQATQRMTLP